MTQVSMQIQSDSSLRGCEIKINSLATITEGSTIKISQYQNNIYTVYRPDPTFNQNKIKISKSLMIANNLKPGICKVKTILSKPSKRINMIVKALDWQIINNRMSQLEQQFLNQINIVWPGGKIPLYYSLHDFVLLECDCREINSIQQNAEVSINVKQQHQQQNQNKIAITTNSFIYRQIPQTNNQQTFDYMNTIYIQQCYYKAMNISSKNYYTITNKVLVEQKYLKDIESYTTFTKQFQTKKLAKDKKYMKIKLFKQANNEHNNYYQCNILTKHINKLQDRIQINNTIQPIKSINIELLLKDREQFIQLKVFINSSVQEQMAIDVEEIKQKFIKKFVNQLAINLEFHILPEMFVLGDQIIFIQYSSKNKEQNMPIKLINTLKNIKDKQKQISGHIKIQKLKQQSYTMFMIETYNLLRTQQKNIQTSKNVVSSFMQIYKEEIDIITKELIKLHPKHILITSHANNGKSLFHIILQQMNYNSWIIDLQKLNDNSYNIEQITNFLQIKFQICPYQIIFLDNLDALCYEIDQGDAHRWQERVISKLVLRKILDFSKIYKKKCIMTATSLQKINQQFHIYKHIQLKNPSHQIKNKLFGKLQQSQQSVSFGNLIKMSRGQYQSIKKVKAKADIVDFSKLAGLVDAKKFIRNTIQKPLKYSELYKKMPVKMPRGILLYGATGTGKSAIGNALKDQFSMKCFSVKGSDILSKYIGGSQAAVRQIFENAMSVSPSIIFFDEFQTIVPKRNSSNTGVTDRVVNQFLCYLDGVSSTTGVFIIAASSRPDLIDPALLRPGRLDIHLFLDYPNQQQRLQLLKLFQNSIIIQVSDQKFVSSTQGFNYSDIIGFLKQLRIKKSSIALKLPNPTPQDFKQISEQFYNDIIKDFKISVDMQDQKRQKKIYENFRNGAKLDIKQQKSMLM